MTSGLYFRHRETCRSASASTNSPIGTIAPVSSATAMNSLRCQQPSLWVLPADQRLEAHHAQLPAERDGRLVVDPQLGARSSAWPSAASSWIRSTACIRENSSNSSNRAPPRCLARYIAASASRITVSGGVAGSSTVVMPMLTETVVSPSSKGIGRPAIRWIRSAIIRISASPLRSSNTSVNSSPPNRAMVSIGRSIPRRRCASAESTLSPALWPSVSLTSLKRSTSRNSTAIVPLVRRERSSATPRRSRNSARLGRPVSGSRSASSASSVSPRWRCTA